MKAIFVLYRKPGVSHEQCLKEWSGEQHTALARKIPGLRKWVQNHVVDMPNDTTPDGFGELVFDNAKALDIGMNSPEMAAASEDAKRFLDMEKTYAMVVSENILLEPPLEAQLSMKKFS